MYSPKRRFRLFRNPAFAGNGSLDFRAAAIANGSALRYDNEADFRMGTGSFTIEWFQYMQSGSSFPRVFSIGTYSSASIGVSIESGSFYLWRGVGPPPSLIPLSTSFSHGIITNKWVHFAVVGENNATIKIYQDGVLKRTYTGTYEFNNTTDSLMIGNESSRTTNAAFNGYITNFRWTKGTAVYTSDFTVPTAPLTALADTKLLLLGKPDAPFADSSGLNKVATNFGVVSASLSPF